MHHVMTNVLATLADGLADGRIRVVDLTRPLDASTPVIRPADADPTPPFRRETISQYDDRGPAWYWNTIHLGEHTGTHFDAPIHWVTGRDLSRSTTDAIPVDRFIGPACVIDVTGEVAADEDFLLTAAHVTAWEGRHGAIPDGAWVLVRSGWSRRTNPEAFLNLGDDGAHSPGLAKDAAELLARRREILGVGVETITTDAGQADRFDPPFPSHHYLHGAGRYGLAGLCNLDTLPATGAIVIAAPLKIVEGSGSPVRAIALIPG